MDAAQYVHVDVLSDVYVLCMFYWTHQKDMYVPQYVSSGAVSQHSAH